LFRLTFWTFPALRHLVQTKILFTVPLKETLIFWRLAEKVRFVIPVIFLPTPPFFLALPLREMLLPA